MTVISPASPPSPSRVRAGTLVPLGWAKWRVLKADGTPSGLIEAHETHDGVRYRALRYRWSSRAFIEVGEFWSLDDARGALSAG